MGVYDKYLMQNLTLKHTKLSKMGHAKNLKIAIAKM